MRDRFGSPTIFLHWFMLALLAAVYTCIELRTFWPKGSDLRELLKTWHFMLGLSVFALVWIRLYARVRGGTPPIVPAPPAWQMKFGHVMHLALYLLMICMPIAGWLILSAEGKTIPFYGLELPPLIATDKPLAKQIEEIHETVGTIGYWLIGLHAAASLFHHYVQRDNTLARMWMRRSTSGG